MWQKSLLAFWNPPVEVEVRRLDLGACRLHQSTSLYPWKSTQSPWKEVFPKQFTHLFLFWDTCFSHSFRLRRYQNIESITIYVLLVQFPCATCLFLGGSWCNLAGAFFFLNCGSIKAQETSKALTSLTANDSPNLNLIITNPKIKMKRWM